LSGGIFKFSQIASEQGQVRPAFSKSLCQAQADAAGAARDDHMLVQKILGI
jgi:hypothetical protein